MAPTSGSILMTTGGKSSGTLDQTDSFRPRVESSLPRKNQQLGFDATSTCGRGAVAGAGAGTGDCRWRLRGQYHGPPRGQTGENDQRRGHRQL